MGLEILSTGTWPGVDTTGGSISPASAPAQVGLGYMWTGTVWVPVRRVPQDGSASGEALYVAVAGFDAQNATIRPVLVQAARFLGVSHRLSGNVVGDSDPNSLNVANGFDSAGNPDTMRLLVRDYVFNGATWDRVRNNVDATLFASAGRTPGTYNSPDQTNFNGRGARFIIDITGIGLGATLDFKLQSKDTTSGKYVDILNASIPQQNALGTVELVVYPGIDAAPNRQVSTILSRTWRGVATVGVASVTFSVGFSLIV